VPCFSCHLPYARSAATPHTHHYHCLSPSPFLRPFLVGCCGTHTGSVMHTRVYPTFPTWTHFPPSPPWPHTYIAPLHPYPHYSVYHGLHDLTLPLYLLWTVSSAFTLHYICLHAANLYYRLTRFLTTLTPYTLVYRCTDGWITTVLCHCIAPLHIPHCSSIRVYRANPTLPPLTTAADGAHNCGTPTP